MNRFELSLGQPGATWGNLKTEVAPFFVPCRQWFMKTWGNRGNLFESHTHAREGKFVFPLSGRNWQKVAPVAPAERKRLGGRGLKRGNLKNEVARGCPKLPRKVAV
jgi:hypothetical protein